MSDRHKPHFGRDRSGHRKVRQEDVEDKVADVHGEEYLRDEVRLGGAVEDIGPAGGQAAREIEALVEENRDDVAKLVHAPRDDGRGRPRRSRRAR